MHIRLRNVEWSGNYVWWIGLNIKKWLQSTLTLGRYVEQCQRPESDELFSGPKLEPRHRLNKKQKCQPLQSEEELSLAQGE